MELFEALRTRRSIRKFTGGPVSCEALERIVDAGRLAASGNNRQPWEFIAVTERDILRKLRIPEDHWSQKAGAMIAVISQPESPWWVEDAAATVQNMLLACHALGYGACWIEGYTRRNEEIFKAVLGIPENCRLFTLIAVGVPAEQPLKEKKPLEEVLHWQHYQPKTWLPE
jgi:nitroreductase